MELGKKRLQDKNYFQAAAHFQKVGTHLGLVRINHCVQLWLNADNINETYIDRAEASEITDPEIAQIIFENIKIRRQSSDLKENLAQACTALALLEEDVKQMAEQQSQLDEESTQLILHKAWIASPYDLPVKPTSRDISPLPADKTRGMKC